MSDQTDPYKSPPGPAPTPVDVLGFDPYGPDYRREPYEKYRQLAERGDLFHTRTGLVVATSHAAVSALLRDPRFGHGSTPPANPGQPRGSFLVMDPPDHTRLRGLVSKAFTPRMIERLRPRIEAIAQDLIGAMGRETDLIAAYAYPLPVMVITEMLGVPPEDHERFRGWSEILARGIDPLLPAGQLASTDRARTEFRAYFRELAAVRRRRPGEDLLSALVRLEELTEPELLATCVLLLVAGHETTVNLIGNGVLQLLRHDLLHLAAESPGQVVEEVLRYDPPVQLTLRVALQDAELGDTPIPAGTAVLGLLGAANRDPAVFPGPDRFDPGRPSPRHLAFGLGIHFCLGANLARMEGEIALRALAEAAPGLKLADAAPPYKENVVLRGLAALPTWLS